MDRWAIWLTKWSAVVHCVLFSPGFVVRRGGRRARKPTGSKQKEMKMVRKAPTNTTWHKQARWRIDSSKPSKSTQKLTLRPSRFQRLPVDPHATCRKYPHHIQVITRRQAEMQELKRMTLASMVKCSRLHKSSKALAHWLDRSSPFSVAPKW